MQNRDFKGVWIPKEIWLNTELSITDKVLLAEIDSLDNENHCTASNEYFSEFFKVSVPTISRSIKKLKDLGFIETEMVNSNTGSYRIIKVIQGSNQNDETGLINLTTNYNSNNNKNTKQRNRTPDRTFGNKNIKLDFISNTNDKKGYKNNPMTTYTAKTTRTNTNSNSGSGKFKNKYQTNNTMNNHNRVASARVVSNIKKQNEKVTTQYQYKPKEQKCFTRMWFYSHNADFFRQHLKVRRK